VWQLIKEAAAAKKKKIAQTLGGKTLALLFEKPSLRTRVSFDVAMDQLGVIASICPSRGRPGKREPVSDVARVLSRLLTG